MKKIVFILFTVSFLITACINEDDLVLSTTFQYSPEFSFPIGKPEIFMEDYIAFLNNFESLPDSLVSEGTSFSYNDEYYFIPSILTNIYTEEFSIQSIQDETSNIESLMFRTNITNKIPGDILVQVYFADANFDYMDSLYQEGPLFIENAEIDDQGNVIDSTLVQDDTYISVEKINEISEASYIIIYTGLSIVNTPGVFARYYLSQDLVVQLGARLGMNIKLE